MNEDNEILYESEEEALSAAWLEMMKDEGDITARIKEIRKEWEDKSKNDSSHSVGFYRVLLDLIDRLEEELRHHLLFTAPEDGWGYSISIDTDGAEITLECMDECTLDEHGYPEFITTESYTLIRVETRELTLEEYASVYGIEAGTVRQWIRRGKIRTAIKRGNEWRIPELTELPGRGYKPANYYWRRNEKLMRLPEEYAFLDNYCHALLKQDETEKGYYIITFTGPDFPDKNMRFNAKEKEKLELFLISHPQIKYTNERIAAYS